MNDRIKSHPFHTNKDLQDQLMTYEKKLSLESKILQLKTELKAASQDVVMVTQLKHMQIVLRRLEHTNASNVIDVKGRVACEISTCDELLATELMFNGVFNDLTVEQTVALCSCLIYNEKVST